MITPYLYVIWYIKTFKAYMSFNFLSEARPKKTFYEFSAEISGIVGVTGKTYHHVDFRCILLGTCTATRYSHYGKMESATHK